MEKIRSFQVDHIKLVPGIYISRVDLVANVPLITVDIRLVKPNHGVYITPGVSHTIEHLVATYVRNSAYKSEIIYFGPMGCQTGFYLIISGHVSEPKIIKLIQDAFAFVENYEGEIPGVSEIECGNSALHDLAGAKYVAKDYNAIICQKDCFDKYPE